MTGVEKHITASNRSYEEHKATINPGQDNQSPIYHRRYLGGTTNAYSRLSVAWDFLRGQGKISPSL